MFKHFCSDFLFSTSSITHYQGKATVLLRGQRGFLSSDQQSDHLVWPYFVVREFAAGHVLSSVFTQHGRRFAVRRPHCSVFEGMCNTIVEKWYIGPIFLRSLFSCDGGLIGLSLRQIARDST